MMNKQRTPVSKKKVTTSRSRANQKSASSYYVRCQRYCKKTWRQLKVRKANFLKRRPHRSFHLTRRRDYVRSLHVPGYWSLTTQAVKMIWSNKRLFFGLALVYALIVFVLAGLMDQETYKKIKALAEGTVEKGAVSDLFATFSIFGGVVYGQLTNQPNNALQQILGVLALIMVWLTTIWLLRSVSSGNSPTIRDGLYRAGAPLVAFIVLLFIVLCQLLPAAGGVILYTTLQTADVLNQTPLLMIAAAITGLLGVLSLYWLTSTAFAMIIVTLPGTYPMRAVRMAGDIVVGRRIRILLRMLWLAIMLALLWVIILIPTIKLDAFVTGWIDQTASFPLVPIMVLLVASFSVVFSATYTYLFYRKVVADDSAPA